MCLFALEFVIVKLINTTITTLKRLTKTIHFKLGYTSTQILSCTFSPDLRHYLNSSYRPKTSPKTDNCTGTSESEEIIIHSRCLKLMPIPSMTIYSFNFEQVTRVIKALNDTTITLQYKIKIDLDKTFKDTINLPVPY